MPTASESFSIASDTKIARGMLMLLLAIVMVAFVLSFSVMYGLTHKASASVYYTGSAMIDLNDEGFSSVIASAVVPYTTGFYELAAVLIVDGLVKSIIIALGIAVVISAITELDIGTKIISIRQRHMKDHVIVCGYSRLGEIMCQQLQEKKVKFVIIDKDPAKGEELRSQGYDFVEGDFTEKAILERANISHAGAVVLCSDKDFINLLGVVTARRINGAINIVCRARSEQAVTKMHRAGASLCIIPELVAGIELGNKLVGV